jgi:2-phosphoglycolate phosphatase
MKQPIRAVLFDLDGTLLDTAPDLVFALNLLRKEQQLPDLGLAEIRAIASLGAKAMLKHAFNLDENHQQFPIMRDKFMSLYQQHIVNSTRLFPGMEQVLAHLDEQHIPWGIVTNKLTQHAASLLTALALQPRLACLVAGDTLAQIKPHPAPILHACQQLGRKPEECVYIGDAATDIQASKAAGTKSLVALYGYLLADDQPLTWDADGYLQQPTDIIDWLKQYPMTE